MELLFVLLLALVPIALAIAAARVVAARRRAAVAESLRAFGFAPDPTRPPSTVGFRGNFSGRVASVAFARGKTAVALAARVPPGFTLRADRLPVAPAAAGAPLDEVELARRYRVTTSDDALARRLLTDEVREFVLEQSPARVDVGGAGVAIELDGEERRAHPLAEALRLADLVVEGVEHDD